MKTFLVCLLLSLHVSSAIASEWVEYFRDSDDSRFYIEKGTKTATDNMVLAWKKFEDVNGNGSNYLVEIDCEQRMYTVRSMEPFDQNDFQGWNKIALVMDGWTNPVQSWKDITATDDQEAMFKTWCKK